MLSVSVALSKSVWSAMECPIRDEDVFCVVSSGGKIVAFLEKVEQSGKWPQHACTTVFFLIPENVTSERPVALMPTLIRWWEALRAPEEAKWQQQYRVDWDATDGRNGGAQRTVWEVLMEMVRFNGKAKAEDQGAVALVLDLAKAFERVSFPVVWAWATQFSKILRVLCCYLEHQRRVQFEGCAAEPNDCHLARVQVELLAFTYCVSVCAE